MGNACRVSSLEDWSGQQAFQDSVIVLQANGDVMKVNHKIRAGELMTQFPQHFLCHASSILLRRKSKMIQPKTQLQPGKIYLLLPFPTTQDSSDLPQERQEDPLLPAPAAATTNASGTTKFVISKHYLDKILSESKPAKPITRRSSSTSPASKRKQQIKNKNDAPVQRRSTITWSPALDSIPEK